MDKNNSNYDPSKSLCKTCKFRFRRVFIPRNPQEFQDECGNCVFDENENIVIMNMCLAADMDLDLDSTVECSHYRPKEELAIPFFKHM